MSAPATAGALRSRGRELLDRARPLDRAAPLTARELLVVLGLLVAAAAALYGPHALSGGFVSDDWGVAAQWSQRDRLGGAWDVFFHGGFNRPFLGLYFLGVYGVFGLHAGLHLAFAGLVGAALSTALYSLLRQLGLERALAGAVALVVLVFPYANATKLWIQQGSIGFSLTLCVTGLCLLVAASRPRPRSTRLLLVVGGAVLWLTSFFTYELGATTVVVLLALPIVRLGVRRGLPLTAAGTAIVAVVFALLVRRSPYWKGDAGAVVDHALDLADQSGTVLARTIVPFGEPPRALGLALAGAIVVVALALARGSDAWVRRLLLLVPAGIAGLAIGYGTIVAAPAQYYQATYPGEGTRVNALAAVGYALLAVGLALLAGRALSTLARRPALAWATGGALVALLTVGFAVRTAADGRDWDRSWAIQQQVLASVRRALPTVPPDSTLWVKGQPTWAAPGIPVYRYAWDLSGALWVTYDDPTLLGYAVFPLTTFTCTDAEVVPAGHWYSAAQASAYGRTVFVQVYDGIATPIADQATCLATANDVGAGVWSLERPEVPVGFNTG